MMDEQEQAPIIDFDEETQEWLSRGWADTRRKMVEVADLRGLLLVGVSAPEAKEPLIPIRQFPLRRYGYRLEVGGPFKTLDVFVEASREDALYRSGLMPWLIEGKE